MRSHSTSEWSLLPRILLRKKRQVLKQTKLHLSVVLQSNLKAALWVLGAEQKAHIRLEEELSVFRKTLLRQQTVEFCVKSNLQVDLMSRLNG